MSIKKNFIYSLILTASNYIFPLLVYPYISRVLGVDKIGVCNFADSVVNYFVLFSTLGISIVGIREIASAKQDQKRLNVVFTSLMAHIIIPTFFICILFLVCVFTIDRLYEFKEILLVGLGKIIGTAFLLDWFYKGIENFKYITYRTIAIKTIYVLLVFLLIKNPDDYITYFVLTTVMVMANSVYNLCYSKHFVNYQFDVKDCIKLIPSNLINGLYLFLNTMYSTLNVAFLGFVSTTTQVGYYATASKIFGIVLAVYTAFTSVLLPRMSMLYTEHKMEEFSTLIQKSISVLLTFAVPVVVVFSILAPQIVNVISGPGYEGAYIPAIISMPLIFVVGYEQILVVQIITPMRQDRIKLINGVVGACVGILGNLLLVKTFMAIGATIVWAASEISVLFSAQYFVTKLNGMRFPSLNLMKSLVAYTPLAIMMFVISTYVDNSFLVLGTAMIISVLYFAVYEICIKKNSLLINVMQNLM